MTTFELIAYIGISLVVLGLILAGLLGFIVAEVEKNFKPRDSPAKSRNEVSE